MDYSKLQRGDILNFKNKDINITATVKSVEPDRITFYSLTGSFIFSFAYLDKCKITVIDD